MAPPPDLQALPQTQTPSHIMQHHTGPLKGALLILCSEWYTNEEIALKINQARANPIKASNFYASIKRCMADVALEQGLLPTAFRLQLDKRRLENFKARFGGESKAVRVLENSIGRREAAPREYLLSSEGHLNGRGGGRVLLTLLPPSDVKLPATPTLQQLEAARPENGQSRGQALETRDYWFKFASAIEHRFSKEQVMRVYKMGPSVATEEYKKADRAVKAFRKIEELERKGLPVPITYIPPHTLQPGQKIYTLPASVALIRYTNSSGRGQNTAAKTLSSTSPSKPKKPSLISPRLKRTLYLTHDKLQLKPASLPALTTLANTLDPPIPIQDMSESETLSFATCETPSTLETYRTWCAEHEIALLQRYGAVRVAGCLCWIIRAWLDGVVELEERREVGLEETFLQAIVRGLGDLEGVEREKEEEVRALEVAAEELEAEEEDDEVSVREVRAKTVKLKVTVEAKGKVTKAKGKGMETKAKAKGKSTSKSTNVKGKGKK